MRGSVLRCLLPGILPLFLRAETGLVGWALGGNGETEHLRVVPERMREPPVPAQTQKRWHIFFRGLIYAY